MPTDRAFLKRQGANFLTLINDLKRNRQAAAEDLGIPREQVEKIIAGEMDIPEQVIERATRIWPVNKRDFRILEDDAPEGVLVMTKEQSQASSRVFARGGFDYYEYRDTAMSKVVPFRPEWILELCQVEDNDPENPHVQWNNGHFMHQFTMFINAVNFYYMEDRRKKVMAANMGDSMYITPFVPHTFATRRQDSQRLYQGKKGLILAMTYGNKLFGDPQHELSALGGNIPHQYLMDTSSREKHSAYLLKQQMEGLTISKKDLSKLSSINEKTIEEFIRGERLPSIKEYQKLAKVLSINSRDLMPPDAFDKKVIVQYFKDSKVREFQNYRITELTSARYLPYSKAVILEMKKSAPELNLRVPLHQYCYNFGPEPIRLQWQLNGTIKQMSLNPDDSAYLKPYLPHSFSPMGKTQARLLSLRIAGRIAGEGQRELSHIGRQNLRRIYAENTLWYREE